VLKSVFLLGIILISVIFTPIAFGQESEDSAPSLQKSTWVESMSVIYDQKFSKSIQASVAFETINNNDIQFSDELIEEIMSYEEVRFVFFTNLEECVMGVPLDEMCIMIGFNLDMLKGDLGINAIHENGKRISDELITDIKNSLGMDAEFHSIYLHMDDGANNPIGDDLSTLRTASAVFTLPREDSNIVFTKLSEQLINQQLRESGGFYDVAKEMAKNPSTIITTGMVLQGDELPLMLFKVLQIERGELGFIETEDGNTSLEHQYSVSGFDISTINPLANFGIDDLERSKYFEGHFVPLNSVMQVLVVPEQPSRVNTVNTNIIAKLDSAEDLVEKGWFFTSTSNNAIDARFLFGQSDSVTADELVMEIDAWDIQNVDDSFLIENINVRVQNTEGDQYIILAAIIIAAIGAAIFYLKGYRRSH
tara:strand:- start:294 stop:1559 length:1266 start_codon:yes stop_codon:yes gene_type:complete